MLAERDPDLIDLAIDYGLRQVREALGRPGRHRGAGDLDDWAELDRRGDRRPLAAAWDATGPAAPCSRPARPPAPALPRRCSRRSTSAIPSSASAGPTCSSACPTSSGATPARRRCSTRSAELAAGAATCGAKAIWPSPEVNEAVKDAFEALREEIETGSRSRRSVGRGGDAARRPSQSLRFARLALAVRREYERLKRTAARARLRRPAGHDPRPAPRPARAGRPDAAAAATPIEFVLVDEFQDTDRIQSEILRLLGGDGVLRAAGCSWSATPSSRSTGSGAPSRRSSGDWRGEFPAHGPAPPDRELPQRPRRHPLRQRPLRATASATSIRPDVGARHDTGSIRSARDDTGQPAVEFLWAVAEPEPDEPETSRRGEAVGRRAPDDRGPLPGPSAARAARRRLDDPSIAQTQDASGRRTPATWPSSSAP